MFARGFRTKKSRSPKRKFQSENPGVGGYIFNLNLGAKKKNKNLTRIYRKLCSDLKREFREI